MLLRHNERCNEVQVPLKTNSCKTLNKLTWTDHDVAKKNIILQIGKAGLVLLSACDFLYVLVTYIIDDNVSIQPVDFVASAAQFIAFVR